MHITKQKLIFPHKMYRQLHLFFKYRNTDSNGISKKLKLANINLFQIFTTNKKKKTS